MRKQLTKLSVILLSCTSTLLFAGNYYSSDSDYNQDDYDQFLAPEDTKEDSLDSIFGEDKPKRQESLSSILDQSLSISATAFSTLQGLDKQCQKTLKTNFMYKDELADLGDKYKQSHIRSNICECVTDDAMKNISDEHLEKASKNRNYQRKLVNDTVEGSLYGCYNKVVNHWKLTPE